MINQTAINVKELKNPIKCNNYRFKSTENLAINKLEDLITIKRFSFYYNF